MNSCLPDESTLQCLIAEIEASAPLPHHAALLAAAERRIPDCPWRFAMSRGGWYRSGGLLSADGTRIADNLEGWVRRELAACGDDLGEFLDRHDGAMLVTRHAGKSHYFVARHGPEPADFLQLEIEELQEILERMLWDRQSPPVDVMELTEPVKAAAVQAQIVGAPYYRFRRLTDMRRIVARPAVPGYPQPAINRFMAEWTQGRGAEKGHFSDYWVVAVREQHDRYNNLVLSAAPVSPRARQLKTFQWNLGAKGLDAAAQLQAFDRAAGHPGAWYFHMVAGAHVPRDIAYALMADIEAGYGYLAAADQALLRGWLSAPYSA
jgi:hypothetical protein